MDSQIGSFINIYTVLTFIFTYFICSINPAIEICKKKTGQDIRKLGSGNAGSANAMRVLGKLLGFIVVVLDISKVFVSYAIMLLICKIFKHDLNSGIMSSFIIAAIIGHCFPVYYQFKGGKGVIVSTALALILNYKYALICIIVCAIVYIITRIPSTATLSGVVLYLILIIVMDFEYTLPVGLTTLIILFKHRNNVKRLFQRQENIFKV